MVKKAKKNVEEVMEEAKDEGIEVEIVSNAEVEFPIKIYADGTKFKVLPDGTEEEIK